MGNKPSMPKVTAQDRAILDLKIQRDKIRQYQRKASAPHPQITFALHPCALEKIQTVLDREHEIARECLHAGQRERATIALRRRKYQESLLIKTDSQLETLEGLVSTIEFSLVETSILHGLKQGNAVLAEIHKEMNVESVEKLLGETQDAIAYQQEINEMLSSRMTVDDEEAVQLELAALQAETAPQVVEPRVKLPDAPDQEPVSQKEPEQEHVPAKQEPARVALEA